MRQFTKKLNKDAKQYFFVGGGAEPGAKAALGCVQTGRLQ
jgi:hypothetical protein